MIARQTTIAAVLFSSLTLGGCGSRETVDPALVDLPTATGGSYRGHDDFGSGGASTVGQGHAMGGSGGGSCPTEPVQEGSSCGSEGTCHYESPGTQTCPAGCSPITTVIQVCQAGTWQSEPAERHCKCSEGSDVPGCSLLDFEQQAGLSPTDQCSAVYDCSGIVYDISCDGENDGTNTSGCSCKVDGEVWFNGLVGGESPDSCANAVTACQPMK